SSADVGSASAGDDVVIRAAGEITAGDLTITGAPHAARVADPLFAPHQTSLNGDLRLHGSGPRPEQRPPSLPLTPTVRAGRDARFQAAGDLSVAGVGAGRDVLLDGASVTASDIAAIFDVSAGRDAAVRARTGNASLAGVSAGDDVSIRTAGSMSGGPLAS